MAVRTGAWRPSPASRSARALAVGAAASATRHGLYDLDDVVLVDQIADEDDAISAGVGALEAGVMRLYGVVVMLGGWVRGVR
jgi:hypothetical protein